LIALLRSHREIIEQQKKEFYTKKYNEIKDFVLNKEIPENDDELKTFSEELINKAQLLTDLF